jgi:biotin carboxyl carrier protein
MEFEFLVGGTLRKIAVDPGEAAWTVREGSAAVKLEIRRPSDHELVLSESGRVHRVRIARDGGRWLVLVDGRAIDLAEPEPDESNRGGGEAGGAGGGRRVVAPMPGKVIKVCVAPGEAVRKNQTLVIVEAMKMENEIKAAADGTVLKVDVAAGELVDAERVLVELEPAGKPKEET